MKSQQDQAAYLQKVREEFQQPSQARMDPLNDRHNVLLQSPQSLSQLVNFPLAKPSIFTQSMMSQLSAPYLNASLQSNLSRAQRQAPQKVVEPTEDLFRVKKEALEQERVRTVELQALKFRHLQEEVIDGIVGGGATQDLLPNLMRTSQSQKSLKSNFQQYSTGANASLNDKVIFKHK